MFGRWIVSAGVMASAGVLALAPRPAAAQMSDAQILGHELAANQGEVALGQWVSQNTTNEAVRAFANTLVTDHGAGAQQVQSTIQGTGIQPDATEQQRTADEARDAMQRIQAQTGAAMDRAFAEHAVEDHRKDIDDTQRALQSAQNPAVRALLQGSLPVLRRHLAAAEALQRSLGGTRMQVRKDSGLR